MSQVTITRFFFLRRASSLYASLASLLISAVISVGGSAPHLAALVNSVQGEKIILAHSLGNMVVSSAIQDHGMQVDKYFALNSAVASEAYDATLADVATNNPLVHSEWVEYTNTSWSANYHGFFSAPDDRSRLTWRGRFADVPTLTDMFNFYSSGDEVLEIGPQGITVLDWDASVRQYTWHKQEEFKGRNVLYGSGWAGWGFDYYIDAPTSGGHNELIREWHSYANVGRGWTSEGRSGIV